MNGQELQKACEEKIAEIEAAKRKEAAQLRKAQDDGTIRKFETGATRSPEGDKPDYEGFLSPLVLERFGVYMTKHQLQPDGTRRPSDNWQKGIPQASYMKSAWRHFMEWWRMYRYGYDPETGHDIEDSLCALFFNVQGFLHEHLKAKATRGQG